MAEKITKTPGMCGGRACVAGRRVRVQDVAVLYEHDGFSADEIAGQYPGLKLSDVHAALAYYYDNIEEIRGETQQEREFAEDFKQTNKGVVDWRRQRLRVRDAA